MSRTGAFKVAFPAPSPGGSPVESIGEFRCLVVHSEDLEARFDRSIDGKLGREADKLRKTHKRLLAKEYACAADAAKAVGPLVNKLKWHAAHVTVEERQVVEKRAKRGRPRKDAPPPETRTVYVPQVELVRDDQAVAQAAGGHPASCSSPTGPPRSGTTSACSPSTAVQSHRPRSRKSLSVPGSPS